MKKVMMLAMLMAVMVAAHAASPVTVVSGTKTFLRDNAKAVVTFSWDDAHWKEGGKMKDEMNEIEFENRTTLAVPKFTQGFNAKTKRLIVKEADDAKYEIHVDVLKIDYFFSAMSLPPGHKFTLWARITVTNRETGVEVCRMNVERLKGDRDFVMDDAYAKLFSSLGETLAGL